MPLSKLPALEELPAASESVQTEVLDALFEPSPAIHSELLPILQSRVYSSWPELIDSCHSKLQLLVTPSLSSAGADSSSSPLISVLGSHPRLGEKKIDSQQSVAEQANLQKNSNASQEEELAQLNRQYEQAFPGLRYVVFVNGRGRPEIMENMRARIARGDFRLEVEEALQAMCDIAKDRAAKLQ